MLCAQRIHFLQAKTNSKKTQNCLTSWSGLFVRSGLSKKKTGTKKNKKKEVSHFKKHNKQYRADLNYPD